MVAIKFLIGGSTLHSDNPGDLDLLGVMDRKDFQRIVGITWPELNEDLKGERSLYADSYYALCKGASLILSQLFDKRDIDFKFVPDNMPYGERREITLDELKTLD